MPKLLSTALLLLLGLSLLPAVQSFAPGFNDEFDKRQRERAAKFRLDYARFDASEAYNAAARAELDAVNALLEAGAYKAARKTARRAYLKDYPYSKWAPYLIHAYLRANLPKYLPEGKKHKIKTSDMHQRLTDLWLRFPNYKHMREVFMQMLEAAELVQRYGTVLDINAPTVEEAIQKSWGLHLNATVNLFIFLEKHGDRHEIAPRASIGLARVYLIQGTSTKKKIFMARAKYLQFLDRYPDNKLTFRALIERCYAHLIAYRGDKYDVGVLIEGEYILKQAELYTNEQQERIDLVNRLRGLIRRSHQARDYQVAAWYKDKGHTGPAIYYYNAVIQRDPNTDKAKDAARILSELEDSDSADTDG